MQWRWLGHEKATYGSPQSYPNQKRKTYLLVNLLKTFSHRDMLTEINRPSHQISRAYNLCHFSQWFFWFLVLKLDLFQTWKKQCNSRGFSIAQHTAISDPLQDWLMISKKQYPAGHFGCGGPWHLQEVKEQNRKRNVSNMTCEKRWSGHPIVFYWLAKKNSFQGTFLRDVGQK